MAFATRVSLVRNFAPVGRGELLREDIDSGYSALEEEMPETEADLFGEENGTESLEELVDNPNITPSEAATLNGVQVTSMVNIASQVAKNELSRESAIAILQKSFNMSAEEAKLIIGNEKIIDGGSETSQSPFSMDEEPKDWFTSKGAHIPIENGESQNQAFNETVEKRRKEEQKPLSEIMGEEIKGLKGQDAINALREKRGGHVKGAFTRSDIGSIDLIWGDENRGLCHIIKRREEQKININEFLSNLTEVIEKGQFVKTNDKGRYEIFLDKKKAIIEPEITNGQLTFLLTAFKARKP